MTTADHLRELIAEYYRISGMMTGVIADLVTCDDDERCETLAIEAADLAGGVNAALDNLRRWVADPKVLGRDNFYRYLEAGSEDRPPTPDAA